MKIQDILTSYIISFSRIDMLQIGISTILDDDLLLFTV